MNRKLVGAVLTCAVGAAAWGCASDAPEAEPTEAPNASAGFQTRTLAKFQAGAQVLEIVEDVEGEVVLQETGPIGATPLVREEDAKLSLVNLYEKLRPKLTNQAGTDVLPVLADADRRVAAMNQLRAENPTPLTMDVLEMPGGSSESRPNYFDFEGDRGWFREYFCKPGQFCAHWLYWAKSGGIVSIDNWQCTVLNAAEFGTAKATLRAKDCDGIFCFGAGGWKPTTRNVPARHYVTWSSPHAMGRACEGEGVNGTYVSVGMKWEAPIPYSPPPPEPTCGPYIYRAHSKNCRGSSWPGPCADGCGATIEAAKQDATLNLASHQCLGSGHGCCDYEVDTNFNHCGY